MQTRFAAVFVTCAAVTACSKPATIATITGTASLAGKPVGVTGCAIETFGDPPRTSIVVVLANGWRYLSSSEGPRIAKGDGAWDHPTCSRTAATDRTGDGWVVGTVGATCATPDGELVLDATFDCGVVDRPSHRKD